jgi:CheY-like chemotaxis protein
VVDDSIGARLQLARLLETLGFEVEAIGTARELSAALASGRWTLVCVDVELPDARGDELLAAALVAQPWGRVVALVRDERDREVAKRAGVEVTLAKPFDQETTTRVLRELGLVTEEMR